MHYPEPNTASHVIISLKAQSVVLILARQWCNILGTSPPSQTSEKDCAMAELRKCYSFCSAQLISFSLLLKCDSSSTCFPMSSIYIISVWVLYWGKIAFDFLDCPFWAPYSLAQKELDLDLWTLVFSISNERYSSFCRCMSFDYVDLSN